MEISLKCCQTSAFEWHSSKAHLIIKCALVLCHSNADVERSFCVNNRVLTKQNVSLKDETVKGLRAIKAAIQDYDGVQNLPIKPGHDQSCQKVSSPIY